MSERPENPYPIFERSPMSAVNVWQEGFDACLPWAKEQARAELLEELKGKIGEYNKRISHLLSALVNLDPEYTLEGQYVRWGKVEKELQELVSSVIPEEQPEERQFNGVIENVRIGICNEWHPVDGKWRHAHQQIIDGEKHYWTDGVEQFPGKQP